MRWLIPFPLYLSINSIIIVWVCALGFLFVGVFRGFAVFNFCCNNNRWVPLDLFVFNYFWFLALFTFPALVMMVNQPFLEEIFVVFCFSQGTCV